jgi:acetyl-CoA C-acetyltransferase
MQERVGNDAFIYEAIRTPRGKGKNGSLHGVKPIDLVTGLIRELRARFPDLDPGAIDDVVLGIVSPVGDQGGVLPRAAAIAAGLPDTVAGVQLSRFCSSGLEAVNQAAARVRSGWESLIVAGGVESMSRVPMGSDGGAMFIDPATNYDMHFAPQGIGADLIATTEGFTREDVDAFAVRSQQRAEAAWSGGYFAKSVVPVKDISGVTILDHDEHRRPGTTLETLATLKPSFAKPGAAGYDAVALQKYHSVEKINHVHHGGNSSGIVDGAALVLIGSEQAGRDYGLTPRARVISAAVSGSDPTIMLTGPTPATRKALGLAGLTTADIDLFELNEAFASVVLKWMKDLKLPEEKVNVNGGAIAMGHPLGATGAMILGTMVDELERRQARRALVSLCIGGGMGTATIIERV